MRIYPILAALVVASSPLAAQQMTQLPESMDVNLNRAGAWTQPGSQLPGARATTACDDFNRAALGADWAVHYGNPFLVNNGFGGNGGTNVAKHTSVSVNYDAAVVEFDLPDNPNAAQNGVAVHGLGGSDNLYTKVQSQTVGVYGHIGFYHGMNGGGFGGYGGFFIISPPVLGGHVAIYVDPNSGGDTMVVDIDENRDGVVDYTYTSSGILAAFPAGTFGTELGIGCWSSNVLCLDDFELNGGCTPSGPTLAVLAGAPGGSMTFGFSNFTPSGLIAVVYGPAGSTTAPGGACAGLTVALTPLNYPPITSLITLTADAGGAASLSQTVPAAGAGLTVQSVDVGSCTASNPIVL